MTTSIMAEMGSSRKPSLMTSFSVNWSQVWSKTMYWRRSPAALTNSGAPLKKYVKAVKYDSTRTVPMPRVPRVPASLWLIFMPQRPRKMNINSGMASIRTGIVISIELRISFR